MYLCILHIHEMIYKHYKYSLRTSHSTCPNTHDLPLPNTGSTLTSLISVNGKKVGKLYLICFLPHSSHQSSG